MITIDYKDKRPLYEQITERYRELILGGILEADSRIPSVRQLAMELSITPNTIQRAYMELEAAGLIYTVKGRGNFVAPVEQLMTQNRAEKIRQLKAALRECEKAGISRSEISRILEETYQAVE